jgi:predicted transcriptional regulator
MNSENSYCYITDESGKITEKISQTELSSIAPDYENLKNFVVAHDIATPNHIVVNENNNLDYVIKEFGKENIDEIPVVSENNPSKILGTVWRVDVIDAYNKEILKRDLAGEVSNSMRKSSYSSSPTEIMEGLYLLEIEVPSKFIGKKIKDINFRHKIIY